MRIAIAGYAHETNTFAVDSLGYTGLEQFEILEGEAVTASLAGTATYVGGMLAAAEEHAIEAAPTLWAIAEPSGTIARAAHETIIGRLLETLDRAGSFDAVALELHGAAVVEDLDDVETAVVSMVREVVGDVPIGVVLDLHGNITEDLVEAADLVLAVREYPHTDCWVRGHELVSLLAGLVSGRRLWTSVVRLPMLIPPCSTSVEPAKGLLELCETLAREPTVASCSLLHGFPYGDVPFAGAAALVTSTVDRQHARSLATGLAGHAWEVRDLFTPELLGPREAVEEALRRQAPVLIADAGDNPGGGSAGDATYLLAELVELEAMPGEVCLASIFDPETTGIAWSAGVGSAVEVSLGGSHPRTSGNPIVCRAEVLALADGPFAMRNPMGAGRLVDLGATALLRVRGVDVVVTSRRMQTFDSVPLERLGIDPATRRVIAVKSSNHFRAGFDTIGSVVMADAGGCCSRRLDGFTYERLDGPRWPIDPDATWLSV